MATVRRGGPRPGTPDSVADKQYVDESVANKATDSTVVHNTGNETVAGKKTFSTVPASSVGPSVAGDLTTKTYVDSLPTVVLDDNGRGTFVSGGERAGSAQVNYLQNTFKPKQRTLYPSSLLTFDCSTNIQTIPNQFAVPWSYTPQSFTFQGAKLTPDSGNALIANNYIDGATANPDAYEVETYFSGKQISFMFNFPANPSDYQVYVDDYPVFPSLQRPASANFWFMNFNFTNKGVYKITIMITRANFIQALINVWDGTLWPAEQRKKVAFTSDSYGTGQFADLTFSAIPHALVENTGWAIYRMGQGGTGYINDGTGGTGGTAPGGLTQFGSASRMNALDALPADLDLLLVYGGGNDSNKTYTEIYNAAVAMYAAVKAKRPNLPIIVIGAESGTLAPNFSYAGLNTTNDALRAAAAASSNVKGFIDQKTPNEWITGSGYVGNEKRDGNADYFISPDAIHPTERGYQMYGNRIAQLLGRIVI